MYKNKCIILQKSLYFIHFAFSEYVKIIRTYIHIHLFKLFANIILNEYKISIFLKLCVLVASYFPYSTFKMKGQLL